MFFFLAYLLVLFKHLMCILGSLFNPAAFELLHQVGFFLLADLLLLSLHDFFLVCLESVKAGFEHLVGADAASILCGKTALVLTLLLARESLSGVDIQHIFGSDSDTDAIPLAALAHVEVSFLIRYHRFI